MTFVSFRTSTAQDPHPGSPTAQRRWGGQAGRRRGVLAPRLRRLLLQAAAQIGISLIINSMCFGQTPKGDEKLSGSASGTVPGSAADKAPLADDERAELLKLIHSLQERVERLEAAQGSTSSSTSNSAPTVAGAEVAAISKYEPNVLPDGLPTAPVVAKTAQDKSDDVKFDGRYTPNLGFRLANTEYGDLNVSIYTYVRYLNQRALDPTYTDAFGNTKNVQQRQDIQLLKLQIKFLGWILNPKLRYFLYAWTSNANQGQGAQVVLAGNLQYTFNRHLTVGGGIRSLPGTRSVEGNFPFWPSVDSRMIADEFMRPSYTSGVWATGEIVKRLKYQVMLGNNMSTLGVSASRLDNKLNTFSGALLWFPTGDFEKGFSGQGWGDFEHHDKFSTRLGFHFSRSDENKESQPSSDAFENTQLRLSDGSVIFTPDLFGPGITITDARWRMTTIDGAFKYRGYSLEGEYFWRWLDNFRGTDTQGIPQRFDHGFQIQGTAMVVPKTLQAYVGHSKIFGQYGHPWDFRFGMNWFPFRNKILRWNTEALYLFKSPVGYTSVPFAVGGNGWVFYSSLELAF